MYSKIKFVFVFLLALLFINDEAFSQRRNKYQKRRSKSRAVGKYRGNRVVGGTGRFRPYQYVGLGVNAFNYFGDLAPVNSAASTDISFTRPGLGLIYGRKFHPAMSVRAAFNIGYLRGDDFSADPEGENSFARYERNLSFRNLVKELSIGMEFWVLPNYRGSNLRPPINAYIFLGVAGFHHTPQGLVPEEDYQGGTGPLAEAGQWVNLRDLGTEGQNIEGVGDGVSYSTFQLAIPVGIGGMLSFPGSPLSVGLELGFRYSFTDYLDDVSTTYVDLTEFSDPLARIFSDRSGEPVAAVSGETRVVEVVEHNINGQTFNGSNRIGGGFDGSKRGNPDNNDLYFITQIRVTYILGGRPGSTAKFR